MMTNRILQKRLSRGVLPMHSDGWDDCHMFKGL